MNNGMTMNAASGFSRGPQQPQDLVSGEQYRYALQQFKIAHEKVEEQRTQLLEQERQVAALRTRIALLEGTGQGQAVKDNHGGSSVDDFSIKNNAARLEKMMNNWAADIVQVNPDPLWYHELRESILTDLGVSTIHYPGDTRPVIIQNLLRHAMSELISDSIVNSLLITSSYETNIQLARIHDHIFSRDPSVAGVWRRQTFSAAVEAIPPEMTSTILNENLPSFMISLQGLFRSEIPQRYHPTDLLSAAYAFSRTVHAAPANAFYRAFVPELGSPLIPQRVELAKRCQRIERGEPEFVGATVFPGLVKVLDAAALKDEGASQGQVVVKRALVICECALGINRGPQGGQTNMPAGMNGGYVSGQQPLPQVPPGQYEQMPQY